jgi:hypothetical protein
MEKQVAGIILTINQAVCLVEHFVTLFHKLIWQHVQAYF